MRPFLHLRALSIIVICFIAADRPLLAEWVGIGPSGGYVNALAAHPDDPQTLFAATGSGVYKSVDGGAAWRSSSAGITVPYVASLAIDPTAPETIYAGTGSGMFRSSDGGQSWHRSGLAQWYITGIAVDPADGRRLFASANGAAFLSEDHGVNWAAILAEDANFYAVAAGPAVYLGGRDGVRKSTDRGMRWTDASAGIPKPSLVFSVAIDPHDSSRVYAGTTAGLYVTTDAGALWTRAAGVEDFVYGISCDPVTPGRVYVAVDGGGVWESTDGGASLHDVGGGPPAKLTRSVLKTAAALYAGTQSGVFATKDGASWRSANFGLTNYNISSLAIDPETPSTIYAAGREIHRSTDGGNSWTVAESGPPVFATALAIAPHEPWTIYAGSAGAGVFRSRDRGRTWTAINQGLPDRLIYALVIDPLHPDTIYAGAANGQGVWKSSDGGERWTAVGGLSDNIFALAIDPVTPSTIYACAAPGGVLKSVDSGTSWTRVEALAPLGMYSIAIDPHDSRIVYAGSHLYGFFSSHDGGATWQQVAWTESNAGMGSVFSIAVDPVTPGILYAGADGAGVYRSSDGGVTWRHFSQGMQPGLTIYALAMPRSGQPLYAGSGTGGVFRFRAERARPITRR